MIVFLLGPTATGKTEVAKYLSNKIPLEVISCDSMQVYRSMPIMTQAPSPQLKKKVPHHSVSFLSLKEEFNASDFAREALLVIQKIKRKKKLPLIVGGTGLYATALLDGIFEGPGKDESVRDQLMKTAENKGVHILYEKLKKKDSEAAAKIHPNDLRRVVRALEVIKLTGKKFSELKKNRSGLWGKEDIRIFAVDYQRELLYYRIDSRIDKMFRDSLIDEVRRVRRRRPSLTASASLGLREVGDYLDKKISLEQAKELLKKNTRNFAKRQLSWFRRDKRIRWIKADAEITPKDIAGEIYRTIWKKQ